MRAELSVLLLVLLAGCGHPVPPSSQARPMGEGEVQRTLVELKAIAMEETAGTWVQGRSHRLKDCRECHGVAGLADLQPGRQAHGQISLKHAEFMNCSQCHDAKNPSQLNFGNRSVDLDHAYQLCSSCHSTQGKDFVLGSHGKRLTGWKGPRVIKNCADCHDPHQPHFQALPSRAHPRIVPDRLSHQEQDHE